MGKKKNKSSHQKKSNTKGETVDGQCKAQGSVISNNIVNPSHFYQDVSELYGRYLRATHRIEAGEIVLQEMPLLVGPQINSGPVCLGCLKRFSTSSETKIYPCLKCNWNMCSVECAYSEWHINECSFFTGKNITPPGKADDGIYDVIMPLRGLLTKNSSDGIWSKLLLLESHDIWRKNTGVWDIDEERIIKKFHEEWNTTQFHPEDIQRICGILEINSFEVGNAGTCARAVYPTASLFAHDCVPNICHQDSGSQFFVTFRSAVSICKNKPLTVSYAYALQSTIERRKHLFNSKFFWCACLRCRDRSELGTGLSNLRCSTCNDGPILPLDPLDSESPWKCQTCIDVEIVAASEILECLEELREEVESIPGHDIIGLETMLSRALQHVLPSHAVAIGIKHSLALAYGRCENFILDQLTLKQLEFKFEMIRETLDVADIVTPGMTTLRGTMLYELQATIVMLTSKQFEFKIINKPTLLSKLKEAKCILEESISVLEIETINSSEYDLAVAARDTLPQLTQWIRMAQQLK